MSVVNLWKKLENPYCNLDEVNNEAIDLLKEYEEINMPEYLLDELKKIIITTSIKKKSSANNKFIKGGNLLNKLIDIKYAVLNTNNGKDYLMSL